MTLTRFEGPDQAVGKEIEPGQDSAGTSRRPHAGGMRDTVELFGGAQWQMMGKKTLSTGGQQAKLDLSDGICVNAGVSWSF